MNDNNKNINFNNKKKKMVSNNKLTSNKDKLYNQME